MNLHYGQRENAINVHEEKVSTKRHKTTARLCSTDLRYHGVPNNREFTLGMLELSAKATWKKSHIFPSLPPNCLP